MTKLHVHQERMFSGGMLSAATTYRLMVTGNTDLKQFDRLIRILTLQKQILEEDNVQAESSHADHLP